MRRANSNVQAGSTDQRASDLLEALAEEMDLVMGDQEQVADLCAHLRGLIPAPPSPPDTKNLEALARLYAGHEGDVSAPLFALLTEYVTALKRPWPLLDIMLRTEQEELQGETLELVCDLIDAGRVTISSDVLGTLATVLTDDEGLAADAGTIRRVTRTLRQHPERGRRRKSDPLVDLVIREKRNFVRMFVARLLDAEETRVSVASSRHLLGPAPHEALKPYLEYTSAGYVDHVVIAGTDHGLAISKSLAKATTTFGKESVRNVLSLVGWERANLGIHLRRFVRVEAPGALPMMVSPEQARLFSGMTTVEIKSGVTVAVAHGCSSFLEEQDPGDGDSINRFRALNLVHAELLGEIMDVAPLDHGKIDRITGHMNKIVEDYGLLFGATSKEARILPDVYQTLQRRVREELKKGEGGSINAETTRLVLMFEDPRNLGEVRTIHGLKRYLHQEGLRLGLNLVDTSRSPSHSVDIVMIDAGGNTTRVQSLRYAEFETVCERDPDPWLIYPIRIVVEGLMQQLLYGLRSFPDINAFVFGNEVHYYISFRNHPAFLRIDFSPPQRGGMIDLQFLGVSNYELDVHPGSDLEAIQLFFSRLGFDVKLDGTRVLVRYDKETSQDLGDLSEKAEALFRFVPHLMSVDWIAGTLDLDANGRRLAIEHWAERFVRSGVLPITDILTPDGVHVVRSTSAGPSGPTVATWNGDPPYADCYSAAYPPDMLEELGRRLKELGIPAPAPVPGEEDGAPGLLAMQRTLLDPLQESLANGRIAISGDILQKADPRIFATEHPAERFAKLLSGGDKAGLQTIGAARPVAILERYVNFETVGFIGAVDVQKAEVVVRGGTLTIYAARDDHGVVRMGLYTVGKEIIRTRRCRGERWRYNTETGDRLWSLLLSANYVAATPDPVRDDATETLMGLRALAARRGSSTDSTMRDDQRRLPGLPASPGRTMGRAVFETTGRSPEDLDGAILIARTIRPADAGHLLHAAGIVSAGGAVLSHAALLALQFGKPALVTDAEFCRDKKKGRSLKFTTPIYELVVRRRHGFDIGLRRVVENRPDVVREGDLIVLDADAAVVQVLGQERDALALYEGFRMLDDACHKKIRESEPASVMAARALNLRARHVLEKVLDRLHDSILGIFSVEEIALGRSFAHVTNADRVHLMSRLFANGTVGGTARERMVGITRILRDRCDSAVATALETTPTSCRPSEILALRLTAIHAHDALVGSSDVLAGCGVVLPTATAPKRIDEVGTTARARLLALREETINELLESPATSSMRRHLLRRVEVFEAVLGDFASRRRQVLARRRNLERNDETARRRASRHYVLAGDACGYELNPLIGWKAANLAETARLVGTDAVPPWFVVADRALSRMLQQRPDGEGPPTLDDSIREVLCRDRTDRARKAALIKELWLATPIPDVIAHEVFAAHEQLTGERTDIDVALRSSSCDEDTETVARAGEYDSFLHVRGKDSVREHLLLTWAGLWTERALRSREFAGDIQQRPTGGVIIQLMIPARVSGVMQTINVPAGNHRELVINAGLGLGEGVVSGQVATDMITAVRNTDPDDRSLQINYITNDKTTQVVLDKRRGGGTRVTPTLYHQRLRPALEYLELTELVSKSLQLESAYGYPLDLEFAVEGLKVWLLQARPIGVPAGDLRETLDHYPLGG